jgi:translocation and assembly module TamB
MLRTLAVVGLLVLALLAGVIGAVGSEAGTRWLLGLVPGLEVQGMQGRLAGDFAAERLVLQLNARQTLQVDALAWQGLSLAWPADQPPVLRLARLTAAGVDLRGDSGDDSPPTLPDTLVLPLSVHIGEIHLGRLSLDAIRDRPVESISASLSLHAGHDARHRLDAVQLRWDRLTLRGYATLRADAPLPLDARVALLPAAATPVSGDDWRVDLHAHGPLQRIALDARLFARGQSLEAQAELRPAQRQPLSHLQARLHSLDLAPFASGLPVTALSGQLDLLLDHRAGTERLRLQADLTNLQPGRLDRQRLPVEMLRLAASGDARNPDTGQLDTLSVRLGSPDEPAGTVLGSGRWAFTGSGAARRLDLSLSSTLQALQPARLDPRAPALQVSGPLTFTYSHPLDAAAADTRHATLHTDLRGQFVGAGLPEVRLLLQAQATPQRLDLERLLARSGNARLEASARVARDDGRHWSVRLQGELDDFDPAVWWPGEARSAWQQGPHRLDGRLEADLHVPVERAAGLAGLAGTSGHAELRLTPSLLAGVPLAGQLRLHTPEGTPGDRPRLLAEAHLGFGAASGSADVTELDLQGDITPAGHDDRWHLQWRSAALERLAPWLRLAGSSLQPGGDTQGELTLNGRGDTLRGSARLRSTQLRLTPQIELQGLQLGARLAPGRRDEALELDADLGLLRAAGQTLQGLTLRGRGTTGAHQLTLRTDLDAGRGTTARRLLAQIGLDGGLQIDGDRPRWQGQLRQLDLTDPATPTAPALLRLEPAALALQTSADGSPAIRLGATRLSLLDARLALDETSWSGGAAGQSLLRARLEPLRLAPLLARMQPDFGWSGDLTLAGQVDVHATPERFGADLVLQRSSGDLSVEDRDLGTGPRRLGLTDLALRLHAADGIWQLTQKVAGGNLGTLDGQQTVRTRPALAWPDADAAVSGRVDLQVAQLGHWGRWLPAGWRLAGQLQTEARLGGRFGAPTVSGELVGQQIAVRNVIEGVDWTDAQLRVALAGETARIETFSVRAGAGQLSAQGQVQLGETPALALKLTLERFAALQRVDRKVVISGSADLALDARRTRLTGRLRADEGRFDFTQADAPGLADDVDVDRGRPGAPAREPAASGNGRTTELGLRADLGDAFVLRGRGLSTRLAGELRLTSPAGRLAIHGNIHAVDGTYAAYGQKLRIERSVISFTGLPDNPRLDIEAIRPDLEDVKVGVTVTGTAQNPRIRLFSEPTMTDTDRLSWLILGRASDGLGRTDLALLQRVAYALVVGESDGPSVVERLGLDQLSVRQNSDGDTRETVVTLGKQLSRRWYLGYERSLNAASGTWQLIYRAAQRFTLRAQSGAENALDLIWTWKWGSPGVVLPGKGTMPGSASASSP